MWSQTERRKCLIVALIIHISKTEKTQNNRASDNCYFRWISLYWLSTEETWTPPLEEGTTPQPGVGNPPSQLRTMRSDAEVLIFIPASSHLTVNCTSSSRPLFDEASRTTSLAKNRARILSPAPNSLALFPQEHICQWIEEILELLLPPSD